MDHQGRTLQSIESENTIVNAGRQLAAQRLVGQTTAAPVAFLAVGTGTTASAPGDTQLGSEITTIDRAAIETTALANAIGFRVRAQVSSAAAAQVSEAGLFTDSGHGAGTMYNRVVFPSPLPVGPGLDLIFEWDVTF